MPIVIQTKRGDSDYLDAHLLDDGELAIVRQWLIEGGPQDGEYTYFWGLRVGDGTNNGGQDGITAPIAAGMTNALMMAANAVRYSQIFSKDGNYQPPYLKWWNDLESATTAYTTCIVPDPISSNVHLGTGTLLYNGGVIDWKVSEQFRFLTDCTWDKSEWDYYHAALDRITSYDANELTGDATNVDLIGIRESIQQQTAATYYANATFIGIQSSIWNDSSATAIPVGIGFDAEYGFYRDSSDHGINRRVELLIGYNVSSLENDWDVAGDFVGDLVGLNIEDQTAGSFDGTFAGVKIGSIESGTGSPIYGMLIEDIGETTNAPLTSALKTGDISASVTDGTAHGIDIDNLYGRTVRGLRINSAGSPETIRVEGISIQNIGSTITDGSSHAIGMVSSTVGSAGCNVAVGFKNTDIIANNVAYGIYLDNVEGDIVSKGIQLTNIGTADATSNYGMCIEHVGQISEDAHNMGIAIYQIGSINAWKSHGIRAGIITSSSVDGTSIGFEATTIDGEESRGLQIYNVGGTDTTESRGISVNNIGATSTISTASAIGYYADTIGNIDGGCDLGHGLLIENVYSDNTATGIEFTNIIGSDETNDEAASRGVIIWNVGGTNTRRCQGFTAVDVGVDTINSEADCYGVLITNVGNWQYGSNSSFVLGAYCQSDQTAYGLDMGEIRGEAHSRGVSITTIDAIAATTIEGMYIGSIGNSLSTDITVQTIGISIGTIGKETSKIAAGMRFSTIASNNTDGTSHGFEGGTITGYESIGCSFLNIGDSSSRFNIGVKGINIGISSSISNACTYGMYVNTLGTRNKGLETAGLCVKYVRGDALASGVHFNDIQGDVANALYAISVGPTSADGDATSAYGINIGSIGIQLSRAASIACGMYVNAIGGVNTTSSYGLKIDSITSDSTSHGIEINSVSADIINRGLVIRNVDNAGADRNTGILVTDVGVSSTDISSASGGILVSRVGRDKVSTQALGNIHSYGGKFTDIHCDGSSYGLYVDGVIGRSNTVGLYLSGIDSNADGTSNYMYGIEMGVIGATVAYADKIAAITVGHVGNEIVGPMAEATTYSYLINASLATVKSSEYAYGIHLLGLDGTYNSGFEIDYVGDVTFSGINSYGARFKNIHGHTHAIGMYIDNIHCDQSRNVEDVLAVGLYVGEVQAGTGSGYAIHTNGENLTYPGVTCLYMPTGEGNDPPTTYDIGTLYVDSTGQVWAVID